MARFDNNDALKKYLSLRKDQPQHFKQNAHTPIKIISNNVKIEEARTQETIRRANDQNRDFRVGVLAQDPYLGCLVRDAVEFPNGTLGLYNRVIGTNGVVTVAQYNNRLMMIEIYRHASQRYFWEFPGGVIDSGFSALESATQELEEEVSAKVSSISFLGKVYTSPGMSSETVHFYFANIISYGEVAKNEGIIQVHEIDTEHFEAYIKQGKIIDSVSISAYYLAKNQGFI